MNEADLGLLLRPATLELIDAIGPLASSDDAAAAVSRLRREGHPADVVAVAVTQARLRARAATKFGAAAAAMLFTEDGLQQATRLPVAERHAARWRDAGINRVADLGCGIGADALANARAGTAVLAVDLDPATAEIARHNLGTFPVAEVRVAAAESVDLSDVGGVWLDPARRPRTKGARAAPTRGTAIAGPERLRPEDWSPSLDFAFGLGDRLPTGVKLGPGMDRDLIPADAEAQWVSAGGELVELVVWLGSVARPGIRRAALVLGRDGAASELTAAEDAPDVDPGPLGAVLVEPDSAVIRARLIGQLARELDAHARMLDPTIAWITLDAAPPPGRLGGLGDAFEVVAELPLDARTIRRELAARRIGAIEIKKRGVDLDPAAFRTALRLDPRAPRHGTGPGSPVLVATRIAGRRRAILATRLA